MPSICDLALYIAQGDISRMLDAQRGLKAQGVQHPRMDAEQVILKDPRLRVMLLRRYRQHWRDYRQALRSGDRGECVVIERRIDSFGTQLTMGLGRDEFLAKMSDI